MTIQLKHLGLRSHPSINSLIEKRLFNWVDSYNIEKAKIELERHYTVSPPFRISVLLILPGPDEFVEARDHTLLAATLKALKKLDYVLKMRQKKEKLRQRPHRQFPNERVHPRNNSTRKCQ